MLKRRTLKKWRRSWHAILSSLRIKAAVALVALIQIVLGTEFVPADISERNCVVERVEPRLVDVWFWVRDSISRPGTPQSVVIIAADEVSREELHISRLQVWPRDTHARLLETLADSGAKSIFFDFLFSEERDPSGDEHFALAMRLVPTIIGKFVHYARERKEDGTYRVEKEIKFLPLEIFQRAARRVVYLGNSHDHDGVFRRFETRQGEVPGQVPVAAAMFDKILPSTPMPGRRDFINYYGGPGTIRTIRYADVVEKRVPREVFDGKHVFVGQMFVNAPHIMSLDASTALPDSFLVPVSSERMFGVEIHATVAANLIDQSWIRRFSEVEEALTLAIGAALLSLILFILPPVGGLAFLVFSFLLWATGSYAAFLAGYFIPGITLFATVSVAYIISTLRYYLIVLRRFEQLASAIGIDAG